MVKKVALPGEVHDSTEAPTATKFSLETVTAAETIITGNRRTSLIYVQNGKPVLFQLIY